MEPSPSTWTFSELFSKALHQWPIGLAVILAGGLLGWAAALLWPSPYQATSYIYVGLNPYRAFEDSLFLAEVNPRYSNLDDYNHWQMSQLEAALYVDRIIDESLAELRGIDAYWEQITSDELRDMVHNEFRTAGRWSLTATHNDSLRASQAAETWAAVSVAGVREAIASSRETIILDARIQALEAERVDLETRLEILEGIYPELIAQRDALAGEEPDQTISTITRLELVYLFSRAKADTLFWDELSRSLPQDGAPASSYLDWLQSVIQATEHEGDELERLIDELISEIEGLKADYTLHNEHSLGMSPNIVIENFENLSAERVRSTGLLILNGALIGGLIWIGALLASLTRREAT